MKYSLLIIIICSGFFNRALSQSFLKENKIWSIYECSDTDIPGQPQPQPKTKYFKFEGDTLINSQSYKKTFYSYNIDGPYHMLSSLFREENNIVYEISVFNHDESISYDFNLKKGDFYYQPWDQESFDHPYVVDSVVVRNILGTDRKHWYFSVAESEGDGYIAEIWIEGIGSLTGPLTPIGWDLVGEIEELICVHEGDVQIYQNPNFSGCEVNSNSVTVLEKNKQLININLSGEGMLHIKLQNEKVGEIQIYSLEGKQLLNQKITNNETELCVPSNGILLYYFVTEKGEIQTGKVLVK
jgi:hypothetical protein